MRKIYFISTKKIYLASLLMLICLALSIQGSAQDNTNSALNTDSIAKMDKMVDVAYGIQHHDAITSAIGTIYSNELGKRASSSLGEALIGKLPGLTVIQSSGVPGSTPEMFIRGRNTWGNAAPLILVDGFRTYDYNSISVYDVESVSVLKDAASLALYGMEGANGAILITTKRGKLGNSIVDVNISYGVQQPIQMPTLLNAAGYAKYYNQAQFNDNPSAIPKYNQHDIESYGKQDGYYLYSHPDNNYDQLLRTLSPTSTAGLNISGGSKSISYMVSAGYVYDGGILKYTDLNDKYTTQNNRNRFNFRSNLDFQITKGFSAQLDISGIVDLYNSPGYSVNQIFNIISTTPPQSYALVNQDGTLGGTLVYPNNPYGLITQTGHLSTMNRNIDVNFKTKYELSGVLHGLSVGAAASISNVMQVIDGKTKSFNYSIFDYQNGTSEVKGTKTDLAWNGAPATSAQRYTVEPNLTFTRVNGNHTFNAMLMGHIDSYRFSGDYYEFKNVGMGLRLHYGYLKKYFAEFNAGYYGQEQFKKGSRFGLFPSISGSWIASNEDFLKGNGVINYLKLRSSFGMVGGAMAFPVTGNWNFFNRNYYSSYYNIALAGVMLGDNQMPAGAADMDPSQVSGAAQGRLANEAITWDKSYKADAGIEMTLLNHVNVLFDFFQDNRKDILTRDIFNIPVTLGMSNDRQPYGNGGQVKSWGYESSLEGFGKLGNLEYSVKAGLWFSRNKIIEKPDELSYSSDNANAVGKSIGQILGYAQNGFFPAGIPNGASSNPFQSFGNVAQGDVKYLDLTGDGIVNANDRSPIGYNTLPEYSYTIGFELKYKSIYLSAFGQGTMNSSVLLSGFFNVQSGNTIDYLSDSWTTATASTATLPRLSLQNNVNNTLPSSVWLRSNSYFKMRSAEIGYEIPKKVMSKHHIEGIRIFVRGLNLFTISKDFGFVDPELSATYTYPAMRSVSMGISSSF